MRNITRRLALLTTVAVAAFDNKPGWKVDADGKLELDSDGNPIYVTAAGQEQSVRGDTISNLNAEAKKHRTDKEKVEADLAKFKGADGKPLDPEAARKAIETVGKLDAKQLIDAGEVDRVKEQIKGEFTAQLTEAQQAIADRDNELNTLKIDRVFDSSELVRDGIAVPPDMFRAYFAKNFKIENGEIAAFGPDGNRLLSKKHQGEYAKPEEALSLLIETHPQKDVILKANPGGGSGSQGGGGVRGAGRVMKRDAFEALAPAAASEAAASMAKGELQIVD